MLRITQSKSAHGAREYFRESLSSQEHYYSQGEIIGTWGGKVAGRLGLEVGGPVREQDFLALCDNQRPGSQESLTPRQRQDRTVGYDFTFNCPKSLSVLYGLTDDARLLGVFQNAVEQTMREIEKDAQVRVRRQGQDANRPTGELLWATFVHQTARPVHGRCDPHLHAHAFVFNVTYDATEDRLKAGQFRNLLRDASYYEAAFHARCAQGLMELGLAVERTRKGYEVLGVPQQVLDKFSRRTAEIEATAAKKGITDAKKKASLGAATRQKKLTGQPAQALRKEWAERLSSSERQAIKSIKLRPQYQSASASADAVDHALESSLERASVVSQRRLLAMALRRGVGQVSVEEVHQELDRRADVLRFDRDGQTWVTTRQVVAEEEALLSLVKEGRGRCKPLGDPEALASEGLNDGQVQAMRQVLSSTDSVILLCGKAGVGKTRSLQAAVAVIEEEGKKVHAVAPTSSAAREVLAKEGFAQATTVASLLQNRAFQEQIRPQDVILVDESGLVSARDMRGILELAKNRQARTLLVGDSRQHHGVNRGDAMALLEHHAGLARAEMRTIVRQKSSAYREAVSALSDGKIHQGIGLLKELGAVHEIPGEARYQRVAADFVASCATGRSALIVSPTHAEARQVNDLVRAGLRTQGLLQGQDRRVLRLQSLQLTEADRTDPLSYEPGNVIQFNQNVPGFTRGSRATVTQRGQKGEVHVRDQQGEVSTLPLCRAKHWDIYTASEQPLAKGDRIRLSRNATTKDGKNRLNNGAVYTVKGFTKQGDIILSNGWVVDQHQGHLTHHYVSTSMAAQGRTVQDVLVLQGSPSFNQASSQEQFYVSVSRGAESVRIYTDSLESLREAVSHSSARPQAIEMLQGTATSRASLLRQSALPHRHSTTPARLAAEQQREKTPVQQPEKQLPVREGVTR